MIFRFTVIMFLLVNMCLAQSRINNLNELLQLADRSSLLVKQTMLQANVAKQDVNIHASGLYPRINLFATGDYYPIIATQVIPAEVLGGKKGTYLKAQFGLPYIFSGGVELTMPVINMEKWVQLQKSKAQYEQAQWSSKVAVENLHLQLIQTYYQFLVTKEVAALNEENLTTTGELMRIMDKRKNAGVLNPSDYNRSKNLDLDVQTTTVNYQQMLQQSLNILRTLLSMPQGNTLIITDSLNGFNWEAPQTKYDINYRPALQEASAKEHVASVALIESRRASLPKLNLNGRYAYNVQSKFQEGSDNIAFDVSSIGLRLDVPLFQGSYYRSLQKKNKILLESAQVEKERIAAQLEEQQNNWLTQYIAAFQKRKILEEKLATSADNLRIAKLSMSEGIMEFDEFSHIFMEYNKTRLEYIQNVADGILYHILSTQKF